MKLCRNVGTFFEIVLHSEAESLILADLFANSVLDLEAVIDDESQILIGICDWNSLNWFIDQSSPSINSSY